MRLKLGSVELDIDTENPPSKELLGILKELSEAKFSVRLSGKEPAMDQNDTSVGKRKKIVLEGHAGAQVLVNPLEEVAWLKGSGFTNSTIAMIVKQILGVHVKGETIVDNWEKIKAALEVWYSRNLQKEEIWALYLTPIDFPSLGPTIVVVGINKLNQYVPIMLSPRGIKETLKLLVQRGVKEKQVKFAMLSSKLTSTSEFKSTFPKAKIGRDWQEVIDATEDEEEAEDLRTAMITPDINEAKAILRAYNHSSELLNYYQFDKKLWRCLRTASPVYRIDREVRSKTRDVTSEIRKWLLAKFSLLRLHYHWRKYPIDSDTLKNLKPIQMQALSEELD